MSDNRKKSRRRRSVDEPPILTPVEKAIAKYLRFQCPTKKGVLMSMQVVYFNGAKAVECLIESKWSSISTKALASKSTKESKHPVYFSSKHDAVQMIRKFLDSEMFRRVVKVYKEDKSSAEATSSNTAGDTSQSNTPRPRQRKTKSSTTAESTATKDDETKEKDKNKKKKFKFELHDEQIFLDSVNEFYVWIYSPTTIKQYLMGALLVMGCIGVCLFPLWPSEVRVGVYYLSMVLASLLGLLLSLAVVKYIIFAGVWLLTMGKIRFWLLPNLTEDVGFVESFIPLYLLNAPSKKTINKTNEKKENEDDEGEEATTTVAATSIKENVNDDDKTTLESNIGGQNESEQDDEDDKERSTSRSSSVDDGDDENKPQKSSDEDFEVLSKDELETK